MGSYHSEPSQLSVIRLSFDSSASFAGLAPPPVRGRGFIPTRVVPCGHGCAQGGGRGDVALFSGTVFSYQMSKVVSACEAEHEDSPFSCS